MSAQAKYSQLLRTGLWTDNPSLAGLFGFCPLLAVSSTVVNALALGIATTLVIIVCVSCVSLMRGFLYDEYRIAAYALIIAATVTVVDLLMNAFFHDLHLELGIFVPLIATNCIILVRADQFARHNSCLRSMADGLGAGLGFTLALVMVGIIRELIGQGTLLTDAWMLFGRAGNSMTLTVAEGSGLELAVLPAGAFFSLAFLIAVKIAWDARRIRAAPSAAHAEG